MRGATHIRNNPRLRDEVRGKRVVAAAEHALRHLVCSLCEEEDEENEEEKRGKETEAPDPSRKH
jgi:hypothetical protein